MTILYYFGFAQYNGGVPEPSRHLRNVFQREQYNLVEHEIQEFEAIDTDDEEWLENDEEIIGF